MSNTVTRRKNDVRMKKKAVQLYGYPESIKYADHLCACSCWMCGHQRAVMGLTIQERKHASYKR